MQQSCLSELDKSGGKRFLGFDVLMQCEQRNMKDLERQVSPGGWWYSACTLM